METITKARVVLFERNEGLDAVQERVSARLKEMSARGFELLRVEGSPYRLLLFFEGPAGVNGARQTNGYHPIGEEVPARTLTR